MAELSARAAVPADAPAIAAMQLRAWRTAYADLLPAGALDELTEPVATAQWQSSISAPPSSRHRVLVAVAGDRVVGVAAVGPDDGDPDDAGSDSTGEQPASELVLLLVDPEARNRGHGSRLLAAAVDYLRADGWAAAGSWVLAGDARTRQFLQAAGWAPDGSIRELDMGAPVAQVRLHTRLGG